MATIWAGIDAGKTHHHCVAIDESGRRLLSRRVANDEPELLELLTAVLALGDDATWGIDLADGGAALAITILLNHDQPCTTSPAGPSTAPPRVTAARAKPTPRMPLSSPTKRASGGTCTPYAPATEPSPTSRSSPAAARTWSPTAPVASTGSAPNSPASSPGWNGHWT